MKQLLSILNVQGPTFNTKRRVSFTYEVTKRSFVNEDTVYGLTVRFNISAGLYFTLYRYLNY